MTNNIEALEFLSGETPIQKIKSWLQEISAEKKLKESLAMTISTVNQLHEPSSRVVLCKEITNDSILFYTNYNSKKGLELTQNQNVAINFFWDYCMKQIKIKGTATKTNRKKSVEYWNSRPRESQIAQFVSAQSEPISSRQEMTELFQQTEIKFKNKPVPCPEHWGGYEIKILQIEFWLGRENRFHDRFSYIKVQDAWRGSRLFP